MQPYEATVGWSSPRLRLGELGTDLDGFQVAFQVAFQGAFSPWTQTTAKDRAEPATSYDAQLLDVQKKAMFTPEVV